MATPNSFLQSPFQTLIDKGANEDDVKPLIGGQQASATALPDLSADKADDAPADAPAPAPATPASLLPPPALRPLFEATAAHFKVPANVLMALAQQESNYDSNATNKDTGAAGMGQYIGATAKSLGINPRDPNEAIPAAAMQIRQRLDSGASLEDAIKEHFAGPNRKLWGAKTDAYGKQVLAKAGAIGQELYGDDLNGSAPAASNGLVDLGSVDPSTGLADPAAAAQLAPQAAPAPAQVPAPATKAAAQKAAPPAAPGKQPSTFDTVAGNLVGGALNTLTGAGASLARMVGANDTADEWEAGRAQIAQRQKELGGDTATGRVASLVGGVVPALAVPEGAVEQIIGNAGLFAKPAFDDTYKAKLAQGYSQPLALAHAAEAFGLNLFAPTVMQKGAGAVIGKLGQAEAAGLKGAALGVGQAAGEGAAFSAANSVLDKGTDAAATYYDDKTGSKTFAGGENNNNPWVDPEDMAINAAGFGLMRGAHLAPHAADAVLDKVAPGYQVGRALQEDAGNLHFDPASAQQAAAARMAPDNYDPNTITPQETARQAGDVGPSPMTRQAPEPAAPAPQDDGRIEPTMGEAPAAAPPAPAPAGQSVADQLRAIRPLEPAGPLTDALQSAVQPAIAPAGPLEAALHDAAAQHAIDPAPLPEVPVAPPAPPQPPALETLPLADLRAKLKTVSAAAIADPSQAQDLRKQRAAIEKEIGARGKQAQADSKPAEEPLSTGPFEDRSAANKMMLRYAGETGQPHEVVGKEGAFKIQPMNGSGNGIDTAGVARGSDGHGRSGESAGVVGRADGIAGDQAGRSADGSRGSAGNQPVDAKLPNAGADRTDADGAAHAQPALKNPYHTQAFPDKARADAFMDKKAVDRNQFEVVQTGAQRWQVKPRAAHAPDAVTKEAKTDVPQRQEVPEKAPAAQSEKAAKPASADDDQAGAAGKDAAPAKTKRQQFPRELTNARQDEAVRQAAENIARRKAEKEAQATEQPQPVAETTPAPTRKPVVKTGATRARERVQTENPFLAFLADHGVSPEDRADVGVESGNKGNRMVPGFGPVIRKSGKRLDELALLAHDEGFLSQHDIDSASDTGGTRKLADMIQRAIASKEVIQHPSQTDARAPDADQQLVDEAERMGIKTQGKSADDLYDEVAAAHRAREGRREQVGAESVTQHEQIEHEADQFTPAEIDAVMDLDHDIPLDGGHASGHMSDEDIDAIFGIKKASGAREGSGATEGDATATARQGDRGTETAGEGKAGAGSRADAATDQAEHGRARSNGTDGPAGAEGSGSDHLLSGYTREEVIARQKADEARAKADAVEADKADAAAKKARDDKDIRARQDASADDFQLGQDAHDALAGQHDIFGDGPRYSVSGDQDSSLDEVRSAWEAAGIKNFVSEKNGVIHLSQIVVPKDARGAGAGSKAMQQLVEYADRTGQRIVLTPSADFGGNKRRLEQFYRRFDFVSNKGRNKDYEVSEAMYREPNTARMSVDDHPMAADATRAVDPLIQSLADKGAITLHDDASTLPIKGKAPAGVQALTTADGKIHIVANALGDNARGIVLHEAFHAGAKPLIGTDAWTGLTDRLGALYRQGEKSSGAARAFWDAARERVQTAKAKGAVAPGMEHEEFGAYAIEEYAKAPATVRKWVDDLVGNVKAWALRRFGKQLGDVTPAQLSSLAKLALLDAHAARGAEHEMAPAFSGSSEKTVEVDGQRRPIENSRGQLIAPDAHKQMAFHRWFGESKAVDDQGRPLVVYHGTNADVSELKSKGELHPDLPWTRGIYFTPDADYASAYADRDGANVMPVYLSMKNPKIVTDRGFKTASISQEQMDQLRAEGHDGIINKADDEYIVFDPKQVKSASGNDGSFSDANPDVRYSTSGAAPGTPATPTVDDSTRTKLGRLLARPVAGLRSAAHDTKMLVIPMAAGSEQARSMAKDFANNVRTATAQWNAFDTILRKNYTEDQLRAMWEAADQENDLRREGKTATDKGLVSLPADQRETVEVLHAYGEQLWQRAKNAGLVADDAQGVSYWTPRMAANIYADGSAESIRQPAGEFSKEARNLSTSASSTKHRAYETTAESEAALKAKLGDDAAYVKNIRVMPMAMAQLEKAVAGRTLVNQIKAHGQVAGMDLISETGGPNFVTFDHPALKRWLPKTDWQAVEQHTLDARGYEVKPNGVYKDGEKLASYRVQPDGSVQQLKPMMDSDGKPILLPAPLFVHKDFAGPLKSVFSTAPNRVYQGLMQLKGAVTSAIMISPLTHNLVIWGKALPTMSATMGWKNNLKNAGTLGLRAYFVGNDARGNTALMHELIGAGLVPVSGRGMNQDIEAIANGLKPGRSLTAKALGRVFDVASPNAGDTARRAVDKAGEIWHEHLLWERVADMQAGMAVMMRSSLMGKGVDQYNANRIAAHFANRYAGMIPREAMSENAHMLLNLGLFSKSFTMTNLGAYKDLIGGLPGDVQAQIRQHAIAVRRAAGDTEDAAGKAGDKVLSQAQKITRSKGAAVLALDIGAMTAVASLTQALVQGQKWDDIKNDFTNRLAKLGHRIHDDPLHTLAHPLDMLSSLGQTHDNPHGKQDRVRVGDDEQGNSYYMRLPVGKVGEEMKAYGNMSSGMSLLHNKMSTFVRPIADLMANEDFTGKRIINPDDNLIKQAAAFGAYWVKSQMPLEEMGSLKRVVTGQGDQMDKAKLLGTATGLSVSKVSGGDAVAEMRYQNAQSQASLRDALPDAREAMRRGDQAAAIKVLTDAGQTPREVAHTLRTIMAPNAVTAQRMNRFIQHASPEEVERMQKMIQKK